MGDLRRMQLPVLMLIFAVGVVSVANPAEAQREFEPLFDKFSFRAEVSWVGLTTQIRLDSELLGRGTALNFEDDLNLAGSKSIPSLDFEWQIARKHRLAARWQDINRGSTAQALTEIQWGDEVIPIEAQITLGFDIEQFFVDYAYYPWVKDRWAAGFGLGLRVMDIGASLAWYEPHIDDGGAEAANGSGPLPYLYFEYRRLLTQNWRLVGGLGWLYVKIGDIEGGQEIVKVSIEYLLGERWAFGGAVNVSKINVDWVGLQTESGTGILTGHIDLDINDVSIFARVRF